MMPRTDTSHNPLLNLFSFLSASRPQYVRNMGYLDEAKDMKKRYERSCAAWQPHLDKTRGFVLSAAKQCPDRKKIVILGSGLLLDVPIEELSAMFEEVLLLDVALLPEIHRRAKKYHSVRLIQHDVTNAAARLYENILRSVRELPHAVPAVPSIDGNTSLVVSLNILSQLWVIPRAYVLAKMPGFDEEVLEDWCRQIVESHYQYLSSLPCPVCLIADHDFIQRDEREMIVRRGSTVFDFGLPVPEASWVWDIVPAGNDRGLLSKELSVGVWNFRLA